MARRPPFLQGYDYGSLSGSVSGIASFTTGLFTDWQRLAAAANLRS